LPTSELNVGGREIADTLMVSLMIVVFHERLDLVLKVCREEVILQPGGPTKGSNSILLFPKYQGGPI